MSRHVDIAMTMPTRPDFPDTEPYRIDDRVRTAIAGRAGDVAARSAAWKQMIDLLCQPGMADEEIDMLMDAVSSAHKGVSLDMRREAARVAAFGTPPEALVVLFANDRPTVAADLLGTVQLDAARWRAILPQLSPVARGILRARRDLEPDVAMALASFGPVDFVLPGTVQAPATTQDTGLTRISDLVARIEAYRQTRQATPSAAAAAEVLGAFAFETDPHGVIAWVDVSNRAPLVGIALADAADGGGPGVDAAAVSAIRRRTAFNDCRLLVASDTAAGGEWRISAMPVFDPASGRLAGYRGTARRPALHQRAEAMAGPPLSSDALRQLVHELRTPLNAIGGFAELIERQLMGPVAASYRAVAGDIGAAAEQLMGAIDDLDAAARVDSRSLVLTPESIALSVIVDEALSAYAPLLAERGARVAAETTLPTIIDADPSTVVRMINRLFGAVLPIAGAGETLRLSLAAQDGWARLAIDRPAAFDNNAQDHDTPLLLGFDFSMRLVRGLARAMGGQLVTDRPQLTLSLPAVATRTREDHRG